MKRIILILGCLAMAGAAHAGNSVYTTPVVNESGLAYNKTFPLNASANHIDTLSMTASWSSATISAATFTDGQAATGSITVSSFSAIHGVLGTNSLTIVSGKNGSLASAAGSNTITVSTNAKTLTGQSFVVNGITLLQGRDWVIAPSSPPLTAASIATAIQGNTDFLATASSNVVTITCSIVGKFCNAFTLTASSTAFSLGGATFSGGLDSVYFTLNGTILTNGTDWVSTGFSSTNTATSIASAISANANTSGSFSASVSSNVVTVSCLSSGTYCNAYTLTSSSAALLLAGGATFSGGVNNGLLSINGTILKEGTDFTAATSSATTAVNIANAINANTTLNAIISASTGPIGVVTTTATAVGANNYSLWTSTNAALRPFANAMRGGLASAISVPNDTITVANNHLTLALPVLLTKSAGTAPTGLSTGTTYYVVPVDANTFKLATTSTGAVAGTVVNITAVTGGGSFTLTPLAITGTASGKWQVSSDGGTTWTDFTSTSAGVSVSSVTFATPYTAATTSWDFGNFSYQWVRWNAVAPTTGGWQLIITPYGKSNTNINRP